MGSVDSPNPWAPYGGYRDCSQGICSIYCPQWCYLIFPPPPPFVPGDDSGSNFSPLIIALIGILASSFLLITYYAVISKYCRRRRDQNPGSELEANRNQTNQNQWRVVSAGLDEALIKSITVCKYKKGEGLVEGTECAVCLGEFQEDESLRLLPKCSHAFHLPCIDAWLKSHSNCPLCRANVVSSNPLPPPAPSIESSSALNVSSLEIHYQNDLILVVDDREREEVVSVVNDVAPKNTIQAISEMENSEVKHMQLIRRSISLGSFSCRGHLLVADILRINEDAENIQMDIGSSQGIRGENGVTNGGNEVFDLVRSSVAMKRSISTGRLISFTKA